MEKKEVVTANRTKTAESLLWQGEITAANAEDVWQQMEAQLSAIDPANKRLTIDLSHVRFIDSTGLGLMVRVKKASLRLGIKLDFTGTQAAVRNVLRLARLESFLLGEPK
jgi:anti-anti-sigma factor